MSYTRSYRETLTVSGSKTVSVSYPASQNGGSTSTTVYYTEEVPVNVNINVDTEPFDDSVSSCNSNVNILTGAVVATEAAQIASIHHNSRKIANTIIGGFFSYIRSELSQQIAELSKNVEAHLMHLKELSNAVVEKKKQMEKDFLRISSRYIKIFEDLNNELSNRVHELDKPTFVFKQETDNNKIRVTDNDLVNTIGVFGKESGELQSKISASIAKKRAVDTLNQAKLFLWQQKKLNNTIQRSMLNKATSGEKFIPICMVESIQEKNQTNISIYTPDFVSPLKNDLAMKELVKHFSKSTNSWNQITQEDIKKLKIYFSDEVNRMYPSADQHTERVKDMIQKILDLNTVSVICSKTSK
jgi:hypothetical protein